MTAHDRCFHPRTPAARKACRADAAALAATLTEIAEANAKDARFRARREAICDDCWGYALDSAWENIRDLALETMSEEEAHAKAEAEYTMEAVMYVEERISTPCPAHRNDNGDWA